MIGVYPLYTHWPDCKASTVYELAKPFVCLSARPSGVNNLHLAVAFSLVSHKPLCLGHTFTDNSPGWLRMKMVRMMPEKWLSLSYYAISTVKTGLIRLRYGNYRVHVGKKNRFVTVYYGLTGNDT